MAADLATGTEYVEQLAARITAPDVGDVPDDVTEGVTRVVADTVGVTLAGSTTPVGRAARRAFGALPGDGGTTVIGSSEPLPTLEAVFTNGVAGHALDYDDSSILLPGHPSVVLLPPILAVAETRPVSGMEAIAAYALGFEAMVAVAKPISPRHYTKGWHTTSTAGTFGAAAATARLLDADRETVRHALCMAASYASGVQRNFGTMTKPAHAGQAARSGATAALLAAEGVTADPRALTDPRGYFELFDGYERPDPASFPDIGEEWLATDEWIDIKRYPCCYGNHTSMDAAGRLAAEHDLVPEDIESVHVRGSTKLERVVREALPATGLEGKFSVRHAVATAIAHEEPGLAAFEDAAVGNPTLRALAESVTVELDEDLDPETFRTVVTIETTDGRRLEETVTYPPGRPENPIPDAAVHAKFLDCTTRVLDRAAAESLWDRLWTLPELADVGTLVADLAVEPAE